MDKENYMEVVSMVLAKGYFLYVESDKLKGLPLRGTAYAAGKEIEEGKSYFIFAKKLAEEQGGRVAADMEAHFHSGATVKLGDDRVEILSLRFWRGNIFADTRKMEPMILDNPLRTLDSLSVNQYGEKTGKGVNIQVG